MPKTTVQLPNGTVITVDGAVEDIERVLRAVGPSAALSANGHAVRTTAPVSDRRDPQEATESQPDVDLVQIIGLAKTCNQADLIAQKVLDARSAVNRILLPLFLVHEYLGNAHGLTSGQISTILKELGVPIDVRNVSTNLAGPARSYVIGDKIRVRGQPVAYKLTRKGLQYFKDLLAE
jgi:hypothetical protein